MSDHITELLEIVIGDAKLSGWLCNLDALSGNERVARIAAVVRRMRQRRESAERIKAVQALCDRRILDAAIRIVRELEN